MGPTATEPQGTPTSTPEQSGYVAPAPLVPGSTEAPTAPEVPPPPPTGVEAVIPGITPSPTPDVAIGSIHTDSTSTESPPPPANTEPNLEPVLKPEEDDRTPIRTTFMKLNEMLQGAGQDQELRQIILGSAQRMVDDIVKNTSVPAGQLQSTPNSDTSQPST